MVTENRIRELRLKNHITQTELAKKIHVSPQVISKYEKNERKPKIDKLQSLANFFNVSVEYLMGLSDQPHVPKYETDKGVNRLPATGLSPLSEVLSQKMSVLKAGILLMLLNLQLQIPYATSLLYLC